MKKIIMLLLVCVALTGCGAGVSDWSYQLPNNYEVWRINSDSIIIKDMETQKNVDEIIGFVKEFSYDSRYVFTRNVESISINNIFDEKYYVLDTKEKKVYDSCDSISELTELAEELEIKVPTKWYRTSPDPNFASEEGCCIGK